MLRSIEEALQVILGTESLGFAGLAIFHNRKTFVGRDTVVKTCSSCVNNNWLIGDYAGDSPSMIEVPVNLEHVVGEQLSECVC